MAVEGQLNAVVRAAEKVKAKEIDNVYLIASYIHDIIEYFEEGELDGIYLNFSDPWPKAKHEKRRLTYRENYSFVTSFSDMDSNVLSINLYGNALYTLLCGQ